MPRPARTDLIGQRFGRLLVQGLTDIEEGRRMIIALCDCGREVKTEVASILSGRTASCGCLRVKHGHTTGSKLTRTYTSWAMMLSRCSNPKHDRYEHYGERGIKVCAEWQTFAGFLASMGERPPARSIDRIDVNGDYEPGNCRWATANEQMRNRRPNIMIEYGGERMTLAECCRITGEDYSRARAHIKAGWSKISAIAGEQVAYG